MKLGDMVEGTLAKDREEDRQLGIWEYRRLWLGISLAATGLIGLFIIAMAFQMKTDGSIAFRLLVFACGCLLLFGVALRVSSPNRL